MPTSVLKTSFSHFTLCVSDMARSMRFYCDALGFTPIEHFALGNEVGKLMEIDADLQFRAQYLRLSDVRLELFVFTRPQTQEAGPRRPMHTIGYTHLAVRVDDLDAAVERVTRHGGTVLPGTRTKVAMPGFDPEIIYCLDPDGLRVELLSMPEAASLS